MIYYKIRTTNLRDKEGKKRPMQVAQATRRKRTSVEDFSRLVADTTTFSRQEVRAVIDRMAEVAIRELNRGYSVELGDFGTLIPSFRSVAVPVGEEFNPRKHIHSPRVTMRMKPNFASSLLTNRSFSELKESDICEAPEEKKPDTGGSSTPTPAPGGDNNEDHLGV